jgi:hypothetical protein
MIIPLLFTFTVYAQRVPVKVSALPDPLPRFLNMKYPGYYIDAAYKVVSNNKVTYETVIIKGTIRDTLVFDEKGTFLNRYQTDKTIVRKAKKN